MKSVPSLFDDTAPLIPILEVWQMHAADQKHGD
jgi:hypothetical protein